MNSSYRQSGTLWEERYKSSLVESDRYVLTRYRYIELNPVRAGIVNLPDECRWSSFNHNAGGRKNDVTNGVRVHFSVKQAVYSRGASWPAEEKCTLTLFSRK